VVTGSGTVVQAQDYDGWGVALPTRSYVSGVGVQEGYTGKERDAETGLDSFGARYYLSAIGRWAAVDPLAEVYPAWRWIDQNGDILEWDSRHGEVEKYDRTGKNHKGAFNPNTGQQVKPPKGDRTTVRE
jgi:RHS repeat-associated protein